MFNEFEVVALTAPIPLENAGLISELSPLLELGEGLLPGDVGTIVDICGNGKGIIVEFLVPDTYGYPVAITTLEPSQIRLATDEDLVRNRFSKYAAGIMAALPVPPDLQAEEPSSRIA